MKCVFKKVCYQLGLLLLLFQFSRLLFVVFNQDLFQNISLWNYPVYFLIGLKYDIATTFLVNGLFILLSVISFNSVHKKKWNYLLLVLYVIPNTFALIVNLIDIFYYPYTLKRITSSIIDYLGTQANMSSLGTEFFFTYWYAFVILALLILLLIVFYNYTLKFSVSNNVTYTFKRKLSLAILIIYLIIAGSKWNLNVFGEFLDSKYALQKIKDPIETGIALNSVYTLFTSKDNTQVNYDGHENIEYLKRNNTVDGVSRKNVVIIILESFTKEASKLLNTDKYHTNYIGHTPFLDSLMLNSLYFTNAYANGRKSMDAVPAILSSIPASKTPFILSTENKGEVFSLPLCLKNIGYSTHFFHGSHNSTMGFKNYCMNAGITNYYGLNEYPDNTQFDGTWGIWDEPYLQYMAQELDKSKKPFISTVFTLSSHNPYELPKEYSNKHSKKPYTIKETIEYTDYALRRFFQTVSTMPWYNNTIFVVTADHSITPWEKDYATSANAFAIPLIFFTPGKEIVGHKDEAAQQIDVFPTILGYLNYTNNFNLPGNNLIANTTKKFSVNIVNDCYQMIQEGYLLQSDGEEVLALYKLSKDRYQKNNLLHIESELASRMMLTLKKWIKTHKC